MRASHTAKDNKQKYQRNISSYYINLLMPKAYFMYHHFNIQKFCILLTVHLCVSCGSQNKQQLFTCTALTYRFLKPKQRVFTARYELGL